MDIFIDEGWRYYAAGPLPTFSMSWDGAPQARHWRHAHHAYAAGPCKESFFTEHGLDCFSSAA